MSCERITAVGEAAALLLPKEGVGQAGHRHRGRSRAVSHRPYPPAATTRRGRWWPGAGSNNNIVSARRQVPIPIWRKGQNRGGRLLFLRTDESARYPCAGHRSISGIAWRARCRGTGGRADGRGKPGVRRTSNPHDLCDVCRSSDPGPCIPDGTNALPQQWQRSFWN